MDLLASEDHPLTPEADGALLVVFADQRRERIRGGRRVVICREGAEPAVPDGPKVSPLRKVTSRPTPGRLVTGSRLPRGSRGSTGGAARVMPAAMPTGPLARL